MTWKCIQDLKVYKSSNDSLWRVKSEGGRDLGCSIVTTMFQIYLKLFIFKKSETK